MCKRVNVCVCVCVGGEREQRVKQRKATRKDDEPMGVSSSDALGKSLACAWQLLGHSGSGIAGHPDGGSVVCARLQERARVRLSWGYHGAIIGL